MTMKYKYLVAFLSLQSWFRIACCSDITSLAFSNFISVKPAAFGDFNSDELTDLFVIEQDNKTVRILLGSPKEPFFGYSENLNCTLPTGYQVTSVVPGDFDGDALMDFLVTARNIENSKEQNKTTFVFINWGNMNKVICASEPDIEMLDEPLVIDYDQNAIADLFGRNNHNSNSFWIFSGNKSIPIREISLNMSGAEKFKMRSLHSHAFVDMNNDDSPDLLLTGEDGFGIWLYTSDGKFLFSSKFPYPANLDHSKIGQNLFMDLETADDMHVIVPVCDGDRCSSSAIYVYAHQNWYNLNVRFSDHNNRTWTFVTTDDGIYTDTITLRSGDFNNDGYVDMLATLQLQSNPSTRSTFLLENVPCKRHVCHVKRTFQIRWKAFDDANQNAVMGAFYDFMQDGILDVIFVHTVNGVYNVSAFKNSLDYDANFVKVMVISDLKNKQSKSNAAASPTSLLSSGQTFGASLPGPKIQYKTTTQEGDPRTGVAVQLPQSAHFAMHLPFTIFGLGRTPNFIEELVIGVFNETKTWTQIIPNSQMIVVPSPPKISSRWRAQLFVTPSKIIWQTAIALTGTCVIIACIIGLLHWKERREDRVEKLQEAQRFHFDAM